MQRESKSQASSRGSKFREKVIDRLCNALDTGDARLPRPILIATQMEKTAFAFLKSEVLKQKQKTLEQMDKEMKVAYDRLIQDLIFWITDPAMRSKRRLGILMGEAGCKGVEAFHAARQHAEQKAQQAMASRASGHSGSGLGSTPYHVAAASPTDVQDDNAIGNWEETDDFECPACHGMKKKDNSVLTPSVTSTTTTGQNQRPRPTVSSSSQTRVSKRDFKCKMKVQQTRKADEQETTFLRCCNPACRHAWKIG